MENGRTTGSLDGVRLLEVGDEQGEYCGLTLAGLGAEVIKIEPPGGAPSRRLGPFLNDVPDPERSLSFWANNRGKRSIQLDIEDDADRDRFATLAASADVVVDSTPRGALDRRGIGSDALRAANPGLVFARLSPFGDSGPWADYRGSDLVHLALGGPLMNSGYEPDPSGHYDLPPMAPHAGQSYVIAGEMLAVGILAALLYRSRSGRGQHLSCAVHECVAKNTEADLMSWIVERTPFLRQTARHAMPQILDTPTIVYTKDGRWINAVSLGARDRKAMLPFFERYGLADGLQADDGPAETGSRHIPGTTSAATANVEFAQRFAKRFTYDRIPWREAQEAGLLWSPIRKPHENSVDEHWLERGTFQDIEHPELGRSLRYPTSKWLSSASAWATGHRAPLIGEDTQQVLSTPREPVRIESRSSADERLSPHGKPFPLAGVRIFDFSWFLASAGATRFLAALGADVIKVEWKEVPDTRGGGFPGKPDAGMGPQFLNKNPGKRGISLNVRDPRGLEMAKEFIRQSDIVAEGFSPGVMERFGLSYDVMCELNPRVIYVQQSGMGARGRYGRFRAVGPVAAALAGLTEMGGLPDPALPTGWGYSYLDWIGAYSMASAILAALHQRERTGEGQWIDASQTEAGIFSTGTPVLDWWANGRAWQRCGNRAPYGDAAPQGVYRCAGADRWVALTCETDKEWHALARAADHPEWLQDPRFASRAERLAHHDVLDESIDGWTSMLDAYTAMRRLQEAGVPAGVAQTAEDRVEHDEQLASLQWLTEVTATNVGTWPVAEVPFDLSETPAHVGGIGDRGAPLYGEHNYEVYAELLGLSRDEVDVLAADGVI